MMKVSYNSFRKSVEWCSGYEIHDFGCGNDGGEYQVFNLGTDPNQAAINVQNRVASV
jgi:hypothetical protein